jgi:hypothetical protein
LLAELQEQGLADTSFIARLGDALSVFALLDRQAEWEIIWVGVTSHHAQPPINSEVLGYDVTWFWGDHFSAISDCMFFPRWHGTDLPGTVFTDFFRALNEHGLFQNESIARDYLAFYSSFDWTETGPYEIAEVRLTHAR